MKTTAETIAFGIASLLHLYFQYALGYSTRFFSQRKTSRKFMANIGNSGGSEITYPLTSNSPVCPFGVTSIAKLSSST